VAGVHQPLQGPRAAVGVVHGVGEHAVVPPVSGPGELGKGHQLHRGDAQRHQVGQAVGHAVEGAVGREGADVQLVEHAVAQRRAGEPGVAPAVAAGVEAGGRAVHAVGLPARGRVGQGIAPVEDHLVAVPVVDAADRGAVVAAEPGSGAGPRPRLVQWRQRHGPAVVEQHRDGPRLGRPHREPPTAVPHGHRSHRQAPVRPRPHGHRSHRQAPVRLRPHGQGRLPRRLAHRRPARPPPTGGAGGSPGARTTAASGGTVRARLWSKAPHRSSVAATPPRLPTPLPP
jgi:hypothetical protein